MICETIVLNYSCSKKNEDCMNQICSSANSNNVKRTTDCPSSGLCAVIEISSFITADIVNYNSLGSFLASLISLHAY